MTTLFIRLYALLLLLLTHKSTHKRTQCSSATFRSDLLWSMFNLLKRKEKLWLQEIRWHTNSLQLNKLSSEGLSSGHTKYFSCFPISMRLCLQWTIRLNRYAQWMCVCVCVCMRGSNVPTANTLANKLALTSKYWTERPYVVIKIYISFRPSSFGLSTTARLHVYQALQCKSIPIRWALARLARAADIQLFYFIHFFASNFTTLPFIWIIFAFLFAIRCNPFKIIAIYIFCFTSLSLPFYI